MVTWEALSVILAGAYLVYELSRTRQKRDPNPVPNQQLIDRLREEVENLKVQQKRQRWNDVGLALLMLVIVIVHLSGTP